MNTFVDAILFFLPAGIANMAPPIANKIPHLNRWHTPMDFGKSLHGTRIFGDHKTWRGFVTAVFCGTLTGVVLYYSRQPHMRETWFLLSCASMSAGALIGDAIKSFFKRRVHVKPGSSWFPFDQIDYVIGGLLFSLPFITPSVSEVIIIALIFPGGSMLATYIGYHLGFRDAPI